jgi:hypothetical protein
MIKYVRFGSERIISEEAQQRYAGIMAQEQFESIVGGTWVDQEVAQ